MLVALRLHTQFTKCALHYNRHMHTYVLGINLSYKFKIEMLIALDTRLRVVICGDWEDQGRM